MRRAGRARRDPVHRSRRFQEGQRHGRPRRGRRAAAQRGRAARGLRRRPACADAGRRRRVRDPRRRLRRSRPARGARARGDRRDREAVRDREQRILARRVDRDQRRAARRRRCRHADAQCRFGDVRREAARPQPLHVLHRAAQPAAAAPLRDRAVAAACVVVGHAAARVSARRRRAQRPHGRRRGALALDGWFRADVAGGVHSGRGRYGVDRRDRPVGARNRVPAGGRMAPHDRARPDAGRQPVAAAVPRRPSNRSVAASRRRGSIRPRSNSRLPKDC